MKNKILLGIFLSLFLFAGCGDSGDNNDTSTSRPNPPADEEPNPEPDNVLPPGEWGGENLLMTVKRNSVEFMFSCAFGRANGKIKIDSNGNFRKNGTYWRQGETEEGPGEIQPALYAGAVSADGKTVALTVTYENPENEGETLTEDYVLHKGEDFSGVMCE